MRYIVCVVLILLLHTIPLSSQGFVFGLKAGPSIATQQWNGFSGRGPLFRYHGDAFIESIREDNQFGFYAQVGYHIKGSSLHLRRYYDPIGMEEYPARTNTMQFHNTALVLGAKKKFDWNIKALAYYGFGLRLDYNIRTKLGGFFKTYEGLENKFTYGVTVQAGLEFPFSEFVSGMLEASVSPDFSKQIYIPPQPTGFSDQNGNPIILQEQNITNVVFEISVGLRFLRKVIYID